MRSGAVNEHFDIGETTGSCRVGIQCVEGTGDDVAYRAEFVVLQLRSIELLVRILQILDQFRDAVGGARNELFRGDPQGER